MSGATQAPIASMFIIFEMSQNYTLIAPLIITSIVASLITTFIKKESIYTQKLALNGIYLHKNRKENRLKNSERYIIKSTPLKTVIRECIESNSEILPVLESENSKVFCGVVSLKSLKWILEDNLDSLNTLIKAIDVMESTIVISDDCDWMDALEIFALYNSELQKNALADMIGGEDIIEKKKLPFSDGYWIELLDEYGSFINKKIGEIDFFRKYSLEIILIYNKKDNIKTIPTANYTIKKGDQFIILGKLSEIDQYKNLAKINLF